MRYRVWWLVGLPFHRGEESRRTWDRRLRYAQRLGRWPSTYEVDRLP